MTAQIADTLVVEGLEYDIVGIQGDAPFDPGSLDMHPVMIHTGCYAGYYYTVSVVDGGLQLTRLDIRQEPPVFPEVGGVVPEVDDMGVAHYLDLAVPVDFTGVIRGAREFLPERYVHMGYQAPSSFETVVDFAFQGGRLAEVRDRSAEIGAHGPSEDNDPKDIAEFIEERFDRSIDPGDDA